MKILLCLSILFICTSAVANNKKNIINIFKKHTLTLWDGDKARYGKSWASAKNVNIDTAKITVEAKAGYKNSHGLKFEIAGEGYMGFGWNWLNAWNNDDGMNISKYKTLSFKIKVQGPKLPSDINSLTFQLASGGGNPVARSQAYVAREITKKNLLSGDWHKVSIPLKKFFTSSKPGKTGLNKKLVREFSIGVNPTEYIDCDIYIDDITISK